jgi:thioredoxin 1
MQAPRGCVLNTVTTLLSLHYYSWCGPCRELGPRLEAAAENAGLDLAKVDIDHDSELAMEYSVTAVPTVLAVANGKVIEKFIGAQNHNEITKFIQKLMDSSK